VGEFALPQWRHITYLLDSCDLKPYIQHKFSTVRDRGSTHKEHCPTAGRLCARKAQENNEIAAKTLH